MGRLWSAGRWRYIGSARFRAIGTDLPERIYLDHAATTPILPAAKAAVAVENLLADRGEAPIWPAEISRIVTDYDLSGRQAGCLTSPDLLTSLTA